MGFQFIHLETYARKTDPKGRSVNYVLDEAERRPDACLHVDVPAPPELVHGLPMEELRAAHDTMAADARVVDATGRSKKVRVDQHTLATIVTSHPGGTPVEVERWESLTVAWLKDTYGSRLATVVRHVDEGHPHLHAYLLPDDDGMRARVMHPGVEAKVAAKAAAAADGADSKTANATGDRAYKAAMRTWQDAYWQAVGMPCGLARIGPGRRRLSREAWKAEQAQVERVPQLDAAVLAAQEAVERGRGVVHLLQGEVAAARAARDVALQAAEAAKAEADQVMMAARVSASSIVAKARSQAAGILVIARREAERLKGMGAALGGFVQGILGAGPSKVADLVRAEEREKAKARESELLSVSKGLRNDLGRVTHERDEAYALVREVATERDALRCTVNAWNPEQPLAQSRLPTEH